MLGGLLFRIMRVVEIVTLIPIIGMLAWFVHIFDSRNERTPDDVLTSFIVSILACAWAIGTLFKMDSVRRNAFFVAFIDLCFVGAFIAAVVLLRGIRNSDCSNVNIGSVTVSLGPFGVQSSGDRPSVNINKPCAMLKASWAFDIMNIFFFFFTAILALFLHRHEKAVYRESRVRRSSRHGSRRGHSTTRRSHSSSRRYYV